MKLMLFGSMPSAIHATLTPSPVIPSGRAVGCDAVSESVFVSDSPSGSSCGVVAEHAPGSTFGVGDAAEAAADALAGVAMPGSAPWIVTSGITRATAGSAVSRDSSPLDTVAANELIIRNDL